MDPHRRWTAENHEIRNAQTVTSHDSTRHRIEEYEHTDGDSSDSLRCLRS